MIKRWCRSIPDVIGRNIYLHLSMRYADTSEGFKRREHPRSGGCCSQSSSEAVRRGGAGAHSLHDLQRRSALQSVLDAAAEAEQDPGRERTGGGREREIPPMEGGIRISR
jgi:hypothetical protein